MEIEIVQRLLNLEKERKKIKNKKKKQKNKKTKRPEIIDFSPQHLKRVPAVVISMQTHDIPEGSIPFMIEATCKKKWTCSHTFALFPSFFFSFFLSKRTTPHSEEDGFRNELLRVQWPS